MKLAVINVVQDIGALGSLSTTSFSQDVIYWIQDLATAYYYCSQAKSSRGTLLANVPNGQPTPEIIRPNDKANENDLGVWVKDDYAVLCYLVDDNYDFNANGATDLGYATNIINANRFIAQDYDESLQDLADLSELIGGEAAYSALEKESACPPNITASNISVPIGGTQTITLTGSGFSTNLSYLFSGGGATVLQATVLNDAITLEIDTTNVTAGTYQLYLITGSSENILAANVQFAALPSGPLKFLRVFSSTSTYLGTAFAKSDKGSNYVADNLFDNDSGTRHKPDSNNFANHFAGIIMASPTLVTSFSIHKFGSCDDFRLEGSNDTTTGLDGNWQSIQEFTNVNNFQLYPIAGTPVFLAFRIVWLVDDSNNGAREIHITGRQ